MNEHMRKSVISRHICSIQVIIIVHMRFSEPIGLLLMERKDGVLPYGALNALSVCVSGDFNNWAQDQYQLEKIGTTGIWYGFFTDIPEGSLYKYAIKAEDGEIYMRADPYSVYCELRPVPLR